MDSIWQTEDLKKPKFGSLHGKTQTDVLVIGGGICGLLCAYMLKERGVRCILAEARDICGGVTGGTSAKITAQHGLIYNRLFKKLGAEGAKKYLAANLWATEKYAEICKDIQCDFERQDSFVYSSIGKREIENEADALRKIGFHSVICDTLPIPIKNAVGIGFSNQGQFNPLKFAYSIASGLEIYENTRILSIEGKAAISDKGEINAENIIVATHFPFINKRGLYFLKMYQSRSYVTAIKGAKKISGTYIGADKNSFSFRGYNDILLIGGGAHRTGESGSCWADTDRLIKKSYPEASTEAKWATQDCITPDGVPYIGKYSLSSKNLYVATGFNKWGMSSSMVAAQILSELLCTGKSDFADLFSPSRGILNPKIAINAAKSIVNLLKPTSPRCPHLGCALKYNKAEHTWDCPCHGSRFEENKKLIDGPATKDMK